MNTTLGVVSEFKIPSVDLRLKWHGASQTLYAIDQSTRSIRAYNTVTGTTNAQTVVENTPERLAFSPDGTKLYAAVALFAPDAMRFEGQAGYLVELNPTTLAELRRVPVSIDPWDLAITPSNKAVITSASGQWTHADTYDLGSGAKLGSESGVIYMGSWLIPHPSGRVYLSGSSFMHRLEEDPQTGAYVRPGNLGPVMTQVSYGWMHPTGTLIISDRLIAISEVATNDLKHIGDLATNGISSIAFDPTNRAMFGAAGNASNGQIHYFNSETLQLVGTFETPFVQEVFAHEGELWASFSGATNTIIRRLANPALGAATNIAPTATFAVVNSPSTIVPTAFDASATTDNEPATLRYRWDFQGDGTFDTAFQTNASTTFQYNLPGVREVVLQVMDRFGEFANATNTIDVLLESDPGESFTNHLAWRLPVSIKSALQDDGRSRMYLVEEEGKRLFVFDLVSGRITRQFSFENKVGELAMTPNGRWLYATLDSQPGDSAGFVAEFDLEADVKTREFPIAINPGALVATDNRFVLVAASPTSGGMGAYKAQTGKQTDWEVWFQADAFYQVAGRIFSGSGSSDMGVRQIFVNEVTGELSAPETWTSVELVSAEKLVVSPNGRRVSSKRGYIFELNPIGEPASDGKLLPPAGEWPSASVFDAASRNMILAARERELTAYNLDTYFPIASITLSNTPSFLARVGDQILALAQVGEEIIVQAVQSPAVGSESNRPPVVQLSWNPEQPTTLSNVRFDASGTTDENTLFDSLEFRWDLDGDGDFETDWSKTNNVTQRYLTRGQYVLGVEVRDRWGAVSGAEARFAVALEIDPGTAAESHKLWELPFEAADVQFDLPRGHVWLTDAQSKTVVKVNLTNGLAERTWSFPYTPEALAISPDGRFLYAAIVVQPHDYFWRDQVGYVAEFNLEAGTLARVLRFTMDPYDLAVTDSHLLIAGGSGGTTTISSFRRDTGVFVSATPIYNGAHITVSPLQSQLVAAPVYEINPVIRRYSLSGGVFGPEQTSQGVGPNADGGGGRLDYLPGNQHLLSGHGSIYLNQPGNPQDLQIVGYLPQTGPVTAFAIKPQTNRFMVAAGAQLREFENQSRAITGSYVLGRRISAIGALLNEQFLVSIENGVTAISRRIEAATSAETNLAPTIEWAFPTNSAVFEFPVQVTLNAVPHDIDGGIASVRYSTNGAAIGVVTNYPFRLEAFTLPAGNHRVDAVAVDNLGRTSEVKSVSFRITTPPVVQWITPKGDTVVDAGTNVVLEVSAMDNDGSIAKVEFYKSTVDSTNLLAIVTNAPWRTVYTNLTEETWFIARVFDNDGIYKDTAYALVQKAGPAGDEFYRPLPITGTNFQTHFSNQSATAQRNERGIISGHNPYHSVWWGWVAPVSGRYVVTTRGSDFDTLLGVFSNTEIGSPQALGTNDDDPIFAPASTVKFTASAGKFYRFGVDGYGGATGMIQLSLELESIIIDPPPNDPFAGRIVLSGTNLTTNGYNIGAGPDGPSSLAGPSVWWEWTSPGPGILRVDTAGSSFDTVLAVYSGTNLVSLRSLATNDDDFYGGRHSAVALPLYGALKTQIAVSGLAGSTGGIVLNLKFDAITTAPPPNDAFTNRTALQGTALQVEGSSAYSSIEPGEPRSGSRAARSSVWYRWVAPASGVVYVQARATSFQPDVSCFSGVTLTNLSVVPAELVKPGMKAFSAVSGTEYSIRVDAATGEGPFLLMLEMLNAEFTPPVIASFARNADGTMQLWSADAAGRTVVVFGSEDLQTWAPVTTNTVSMTGSLVLPPLDSAKMFYRVAY